MAGESVKEGFGREIKEEIGIDVDYNKAILVNIYKFIMDKEKKAGTLFKDRAFSNVYTCIFEGSDKDFCYDQSEVSGIVKINVKETLELLKKENGSINGVIIRNENNNITVENKKIDFNDFLVNKGETAITKYGDVLNKVIELTSK